MTMSDAPHRCAYCSRWLVPRKDRDEIARHEPHCDQRDLKQNLWRLLKLAAIARERRISGPLQTR